MRRTGATPAALARTGRFSLTRNLTGAKWTTSVDAIGTALWRFTDGHSFAGDCALAFFELPADKALHVNVTRRHRSKRMDGWIGPGDTAGGFVYNRTFDRAPTTQILRHVREMAFAELA